MQWIIRAVIPSIRCYRQIAVPESIRDVIKAEYVLLRQRAGFCRHWNSVPAHNQRFLDFRSRLLSRSRTERYMPMLKANIMAVALLLSREGFAVSLFMLPRK